MILLLALLFGTARALHGGGYVSRIVSVLIMATSYAAYLLVGGNGWIDSATSGLIAGIFLYGGLVLGWGKGFAAITGTYNPEEKEFWPADKVGNSVFKKYSNSYLAGVAFLTVRAALLFPLFIAMGIYTGLPVPYLLSGLAVFTMGLVYWLSGQIAPERYAVRLAEFIYFAIIGLAIG